MSVIVIYIYEKELFVSVLKLLQFILGYISKEIELQSCGNLAEHWASSILC